MTVGELCELLEFRYPLSLEVVLEGGREIIAVIEDGPGEKFKVVILGAKEL